MNQNPYEIDRYEHSKHQRQDMGVRAYLIMVLGLAVVFTLLMA